MAFNDYLKALDAAIKAGGNFRAALIDQAPDRTNPPTREQLISFLSKLRFALQLETKAGAAVAKDAGQVGRRGAAIAEIETFVQNPSAPIVFTHIDRNLFAFQLALRVRSPRIINQDNTTLCGPVALVYDIAKRDPQRYVRFAISLFSSGTAMFGLTQVTPSETIRNGYRANVLPEADYVVLASVRDTDRIVIETDMLRHILTLTKPGALAEFL